MTEAIATPWDELPRTSLGEAFREGPRIRKDMLGVVSGRFERHGTVVRQARGPLSMVNLRGPEANRFVLLDREQNFSSRRSWHAIMGKIFTNGLLLRDGEDHRYHRRLMREAFRTPALQAYLATMNPMFDEAFGAWGRVDGPILAFERIKALTLDIACRVFLGLPGGQDHGALNTAFEDTVAASMSILRLPIPGLEFHRGLKGRAYMIARFQELLADRRAGSGTDLLTRLCHAVGDDGAQLQDQEIIDHMIFLMMAAHDTTTSSLTSLLYEMAANPEWQDRVREEVTAFGKDAVTYDDLLAMPVTSRVLQETLRRYPPLSTIPRVSTKPFVFDGCEIPEGVMVVIYPIDTHHMEEWWTAPFTFDPDRFLPERAEHERHSHVYVPFGGGNHMCLGLRFAELQIKAFLFQLVQRYRWTIPDGYEMPVQQAPISKPTDGLPLRLEAIA